MGPGVIIGLAVAGVLLLLTIGFVLIYNRLKDLGQLDKLSQTRDDKGYADVSYPRTINIRGKK